MFLARCWLDHHRFPSEVRTLDRGEKAFLMAAMALQDEAQAAERDKATAAARAAQAAGTSKPAQVRKR